MDESPQRLYIFYFIPCFNLSGLNSLPEKTKMEQVADDVHHSIATEKRWKIAVFVTMSHNGQRWIPTPTAESSDLGLNIDCTWLNPLTLKTKAWCKCVFCLASKGVTVVVIVHVKVVDAERGMRRLPRSNSNRIKAHESNFTFIENNESPAWIVLN